MKQPDELIHLLNQAANGPTIFDHLQFMVRLIKALACCAL